VQSGAGEDRAVEFCENGEEMGSYWDGLMMTAAAAARALLVMSDSFPRGNVPHNVSDTIVDAESRLVPGEEGEEHGVVWEERDALG